MTLAAIVSACESTAFHAYFSLISPALRDAARGPLRRARHNGRPCSGVDRTRWCDECEQVIADHLLDGYGRLRKTLAGVPPRTRTGETVREMESAVRWLTSSDAAGERLDLVARQLRGWPSEEESCGVRAARAQLVYHPLRSLEARVRRADAMSRGASAKPERDLRTSDWAKPLRVDGVAFELLEDAVIRLRNGGVDLYDVPRGLLERLRLDLPAARRMLRDSLERLRALRPGFYAANVAGYLGEEALFPGGASLQGPEELFILGEEKEAARRTLGKLLTGGQVTARPVRARYLELTARLSADVPPDGTGLIAWITNEFGITITAAERFLQRLIHLVTLADLDWVAEQCSTVASTATEPEKA
ncbi:hypothetical protein [Microtetraspora sp. NBRC 16547]|uniref:hypothetical protein n=1 Tax=Microtetraspora sp. NBRC 16547 TaxID=3030993 RepID=UPI0024A4E0F3|nr:hypothetical protein [Microtetraspora sp. NBRC 16547]GLW98929.1 hypothetical protein Misp02_30160 [Microtetraspora sp. NBRC 16547]